MKEYKICKKGTGKAIGFKGCGKELPVVTYNKPNFRYGIGISCGCFSRWLRNTPEGNELIARSRIVGKKRAEKESLKSHREKKLKNKKFDLYQTTAWKWCRKYVLLYYADSNGIVSCSTSPGQSYHVTDRRIHVGHLIKWRDGNSTNNSTALLFENLAPQNHIDNTMHGGKPDIMKEWLIERHNEEIVNNLYILKSRALKLDKYLLFEISEQYKKKFNSLLRERNISDPWKQ